MNTNFYIMEDIQMARKKTYASGNSLAKYAFDNYSLRPPPEEIIHNCHELAEYLEKAHNFRLLDEYIEYLNKPKRRKYHTSDFSISQKAIDSTISACNMWKEFIDTEYYNLLVCKQIVLMVQTHSSVISARNFQEKHGFPLKVQPSKTFVTIVNYMGNIIVYP